MDKKEYMYSIGANHFPGVSKLVEETGEVLQVVGKLLGTGGAPNHWDGTNLYDRFAEEVADVLAAVDFMLQTIACLSDRKAFIEKRREEKLNTFLKWHRDIQT